MHASVLRILQRPCLSSYYAARAGPTGRLPICVPSRHIVASPLGKLRARSVSALLCLLPSAMQRLRPAAFLRLLSSTVCSARTATVRTGLSVPACDGGVRRLAAADWSRRWLSTAAEQSLSASGIDGAYRRV